MQKRRPNRDGAVLLAGERALPIKTPRRSPPPTGYTPPTYLSAVRRYRGQRYVLWEVVEDNSHDPSDRFFGEWMSNCAKCGERFFVYVPFFTKKFTPERKCLKHRAPEVRVKP